MNRFCYRVIFSKSLGRLVVVSEKTRSQGKSDNPSTVSSAPSTTSLFGLGLGFGLKTLTLSLLLGLGLIAHANPTTIIADPSADKSLQPIILPTASGIVSVNIQTPNARGLSNNHYSQFDVGNTGVVLNNNRQATNTQIAGFVQANPFMARGEANTILNQINSNHPSHLGGFIEIAGKKADVIIANPSGLIINGAGFINAGNVHLAAANSQVHQGQPSGYEVGGNHASNITVNGKLNLQGTDYAALIAKTAQIHDEIYAGNTLDVILGENQISLQEGDFTKLNATNKQTNVSSASQTTNNKEQQGAALDISSLGGMYAGKIHLVGTDKGFGVNNQGAVLATGTGSNGGLTLDAQGNLVNTGVMSAKDKLAVNTHNHAVQNDGTLLSEQADITINTNTLNNTGIIHSTQTAKIAAKEAIENLGSIYGGVLQVHTDKLNNTGQLIQTGTGKLDITTDTLINTDKAVIGQSLYEQTSIPAPSTPSSDQSAGSISSEPTDNTATNPQPPTLSDSGSNSQTKPIPNARGHIIATNSIHNTGNQALITATGDIGISADKTSNSKQASIDAATLNTNTLVNTDSKIALDDINWQLTSFDNSKGDISAKDGMVIDSESTTINSEGSLTSGGDMTLIAKDNIINQGGSITAREQADITAKELQNGGSITADTLTITQLADYTHTDQDKLVANRLAFTTTGKLINQSQLTANQDLTLSASHIDNSQAGSITSGNHTQITSQTSINNQGLINGEKTLVQAINTIDNLAGGRIYGTHLAIQADTLNNTPAKASDTDSHHTVPVIAARERLDIGVNTLNNNPNPDRAGKFNEDFDNQTLITSLGSLHIGGSLDDNHHATGKAQTVVNKGATIESAGQMQVDTKTLLNTNADFKKHTVKVDAESVYGQTLYRNREQSESAPNVIKSTDVADLGNKPMAGLFDCPEGSDCIINYDNNSAIWEYFKIDAPKQPIPNIKAKDLLDGPELPKDETAESCALAGANNQACAQYNKELANYTKVMGPLLQWEEDNAAAIEALELAIREYNRQFNKNKSDVDLALNIYTTDEAYLGPTSRKGAPTGALYVKQANGDYHRVGEEIDEITVDFVVYEDKTLTSDPARMVAGQNLIIHGDTLINDKSQMNAGNGFAIVGDTVIQTPDNGLYGEKTKVTENGRYVSRTVEPSGLGGRRHKRVDIGSGSFVRSFAPLATYELPILNAAINTTPNSTSIDKPATGSDFSVIIDVNDNTLTIPTSALYTINADSPNQPLIQTDPAFTNYKQWLSSDYMLKALQSDPNHNHKHLFHGYGEQQRIKDEYYLLTGRHINTDYRSNEEAFKQLMDNGIASAKQFGYTLGTALTPEQMANLTTDIVWLVKQSITVATKDKDGNSITKTQDALVPKLYLRSANIATGALTPDGRYSAVSARNINLQLTGDLDNNGNLIAKDTAAITANNVTNDGRIYGNFVAIKANNDITNHGTLHANSAMSLDAGNQIINQSLTTTQTNTQGRSSSSRTDISQIATISVGEGLKDKTDENGKPLTTLSLRGNQIIYQGATSDNAGGNTQMTAENGIDIGAVTASNHISAVADDNNYFKYSQSTDVGSNISSYGNTIITTTGKNADINIQGSSVQSEGVTAVKATGDVRMTEGRQTQSVESASLHTNRRLTGSKTEQSSFEQHSSTSIKNQVGGNQVVISGVNTTLMATEVLADKDILIKADKQLSIGSTTDSLSSHSSEQTTKKGIFTTAPASVTLGKQHTRQENSHEQTTYTGSLIGTTGGNIRLEAGDDINIINSDIIAQKDAIDANTGNILFKAQAVDITSQNIQTSNQSHFYQKTTGVAASVSSSLVSDIQSIKSLKDATQDTNSRRAKLMGSLAAVSKVRTLAQNLQNGNLGSIRVQATAGSQSTKNQTLVHQEENDAANIHADNNLIINLKGKGKNSDLVVTGSNISVGNNLYQNVEGDVIYQASTQTSTTTSQNSSKGVGFGVYASAQIGGGQSNQGFTINANKAKGNSQETTTTHTNTQVTVGGTTHNNIQGNLTLDGANLDTTYLTGTVGGDLIVKSRQDTYQYTHDQKQAGFSADVGFNGKPQSFSINGGKTDIDASYQQVTHQSGIKAKESTLSVQGQGNFTGGYFITDQGKNQTQFAQGIQTQDIQNHLNYQGDAISVGIGIGANTSNPNGKAKPALQGLGYGTITPTHKTSTTHSAITDQAGLSHINTENFNQPEVQDELNQIIANDFDKEQTLKELNAQTVITTEFGREAPKVVADFSKDQIKRIASDPNLTPEEKTTEQQKWAEGGIYRVALHTAVGVIGTGTIEGAVTTGSIAASAPIIDKLSEQTTKQLVKAGISENAAQNATSLITSLAIATATQSAGVDTSSTVMAVNADAFNRQLHANKGEAWVIEELYKRQGGNKKWSREQIANALRAANFRKGDFYESADSNNAVPSGRPDLGYDTLVGVQWNNHGAGISLNIPKVDPDLVRYIQSHTGKGDFASYQYTWNNNRIVGNQQPLSAPRVTRVPYTDYSRSLEAHNTAVMNNPMIVACALNETRHCREMDQKGMEAMTNASYFIPGGQYLRPVTGTLAVASKIENEGFGKTAIGLGVSKTTERVVRTPQTSAIVDQIGTNDAITNAIYDSCVSHNLRGEQKHECQK
ncbi:two-partner secretion domain-containing protein [Moraxella bovoculi]|uniref:two-partner secretion domain-containing protein n=1 Tax=Moraxella bovoculi TaxID=386891 RepID=UPI000624EC6F|nr:hemagglutinin repeat-containing protein [Moraxella bovoculi]AKG16911.1 filamentous hemagglutinin N-terminal domain-containing protein [Moraxella bovoculi]